MNATMQQLLTHLCSHYIPVWVRALLYFPPTLTVIGRRRPRRLRLDFEDRGVSDSHSMGTSSSSDPVFAPLGCPFPS